MTSSTQLGRDVLSDDAASGDSVAAPRRVDSVVTQARIISSAELLFAERGIYGASLSEITRAAGQRNKSALQYHFGGREGLLKALIQRHRGQVDARRASMLDARDPRSELSLHEAVTLMVEPLAEKALDREFGGVHYVRIMAQLAAAPDHSISRWIAAEPPAAYSVLAPVLYRSIPLEPRYLRLRRALLMNGLLFQGLTLQTHYHGALDGTPDGEALYVGDLISSICGLLSAPASTHSKLALALVATERRTT